MMEVNHMIIRVVDWFTHTNYVDFNKEKTNLSFCPYNKNDKCNKKFPCYDCTNFIKSNQLEVNNDIK
jgi:hypothetical protein